MKIKIERSGGFAGLNKNFSADDSSLESSQVDQIKELLRSSKFFGLQSSPLPKKGAADYFTYKITIQDSDQTHTVITTDVTMPPGLRPIVDLVANKSNKKIA